MFCRPRGRPLFARRRATDISLGGVRVYADEAPATGDRLELELFLPDETALVCLAEVVWVEPLPDGSPARFDVGARFVKLSASDHARLATVLQPPEARGRRPRPRPSSQRRGPRPKKNYFFGGGWRWMAPRGRS